MEPARGSQTGSHQMPWGSLKKHSGLCTTLQHLVWLSLSEWDRPQYILSGTDHSQSRVLLRIRSTGKLSQPSASTDGLPSLNFTSSRETSGSFYFIHFPTRNHRLRMKFRL